MNLDLLAISQMSHDELDQIYALALRPTHDDELHHLSVALVFEYPSLRTRASSVSALQRLGARYTMITGDEVGLDTRESAEDVARTLAQTSSILALRVRDHGVFARMRSVLPSSVRLINLLSNEAHPTQAIADVLTLAERFADSEPRQLRGMTVAYVGDANNVTKCLAAALVGLGVNVRIGSPTQYQLSVSDLQALNAVARDNGSVTQSDDAEDAVRDADAIYTDTWVSMGSEAEAAARREILGPYQLNETLVSMAVPGAAIMHCLPAHRGDEITSAVLDSDSSLVWNQVRHRTSSMIGIVRWMKGAMS